jgi:O-antigen ligase
MPIERSKEKDHKSLSAASKNGCKASEDLPSLKPCATKNAIAADPQNLVNLNYNFSSEIEPRGAALNVESVAAPDVEHAYSIADEQNGNASGKRSRQIEKDRRLLTKDRWLVRNGHLLTYFGLYLFSILVLFRPYELISGLGFLSATAFYFALATVAIFIPSQLVTEGSLTTFSTEVKAILALTLMALVTIPIAKSPSTAWDTFNDPFIKAVIIFIVLVNVVRTRRRLMAMMWLSLGIGVYLAYSAIELYISGKFSVETYRVSVENVKGMFGNPNDMALHFVMMTPLAITLCIAAKTRLMRVVYFCLTVLFVAANMVTYSRGGFLGLLFSTVVLVWKLGRKSRLKVTIVSAVIGGITILAAPGNYGLRVLSIFVPGLDGVGSSDQRRELLERSLIVTARNPWGIGIGNFPIVGIHDHQTHNAFTQVSSELGILGLIAYLVFIISPYRKLRAIERTLFDADELNWFYYLSIGLQVSIIGYLVSSFFASVAYNWFVYYLIAYAVAFRRIYSIENGLEEKTSAPPQWQPAEAV